MLVQLTHDVKQERNHVIVQRLVIQEALGQVAQVLLRHARGDKMQTTKVSRSVWMSLSLSHTHSYCNTHLTVEPGLCSINFKHGNASIAVDFAARWILEDRHSDTRSHVREGACNDLLTQRDELRRTLSLHSLAWVMSSDS